MDQQTLEKLLEYIDSRIDELSDSTRESSDGGLIEAMRTRRIREELFTLANSQG
jgi:hypothetical protein